MQTLQKFSGFKEDIKEEISKSITQDGNKFQIALGRIEKEVKKYDSAEFDNITYSIIFNEKVFKVLNDSSFKANLKEYIENYDRLISSSSFFKKGLFNHNNAEDVAKNLNKNKYFEADHTITVTIEGEETVISNYQDLEANIQKEKDTILNDERLKISFEKIDKKLKANTELRDFREHVEQNNGILIHIDKLDVFKQNIWISYLAKNKEVYTALMEEIEKAETKLKEIVDIARNQETSWRQVVDEFNKRFSVPFEVSVENQDDVILKEEVPKLKFEYKDSYTGEKKTINEGHLIRVLSNGEKRALYILNIIFEVKARKEDNQETLFIIDDIADSFDYKNKYAIAEYLRDILEIDNFYQIILSHNFDFL